MFNEIFNNLGIVDFKTQNRLDPLEFLNASKHYGLSAYIERSGSKGYHVWIFFSEGGVLAGKVRPVIKLILDDIEKPSTIFSPKQDRLAHNAAHGRFINAPLFGALVLKQRTVFIDPITFAPYDNQWTFFKSVQRHDEVLLDDIIELNELSTSPHRKFQRPVEINANVANIFGLPPCVQLMLLDGVSKNQRGACFHIAVHLKRFGLPLDGAIALLIHWSRKNQPVDRRKAVITEKEIISKVSCAFQRNYGGYGCERDEVKPYCQPECPVNLARLNMTIHKK